MSPSQLIFSISRASRRVNQKMVLVFALLLALSALGLPWASALTPTLATDKPDYSPGETVHITGTGYDANTAYDIPVRRPDGSIVKGDGSPAPSWDTTTTDGSGNLAYDYELDGIFGLYEARTYPSPWSGDWNETPLASVIFKDAGVNLDQCANDTPDVPPCDWQNGDLNGNNSAYAEGDVVPFRLAIEDLTAGTHTIHLNYDFTAQGHKAYDFLATYNATEAVDLCRPNGGGVSSLCGVMPDETNLPTAEVVAFPTDNFVADGQSVSGAQAFSGVSQNLTVFGATLGSVSVSGVTHTGPTDGNSFGDITVTFDTTGSSSAVLMAWGGHLAQSAYWMENGNPDGATQISGAPWHMRTQNLDGGGAANQDRSIQPSALVVTQSITVVKDTVPDGPRDFTFDPSADVNNDTDFVLDDDGPEGSDTPPSMTFEVPVGEHTVTERIDLVPEFDLTGIVCDDSDSFGNTTTGTATFNVGSGEAVTCIFTNVQRGKITVVKDTVPDGPEEFTFNPSAEVNEDIDFVLDDDPGTATPKSMSFLVQPGTHFVTEFPAPGFDLTSIVCVDPTGGSSGDTTTRRANFDVAPGEEVTCTFTNVQRGRIVVVKDTVPDGPQDFTFDPSAGVNEDFNFILDDDGPGGSVTPASISFPVVPGTHTVTELPVDGFDLSIRCVDPTGNSSGSGRTATFNVAPGESVTCTFTNEEEYGNEPLDEDFDHPHDDYDYDSDDNGGVDNPHDDGSFNQGDPGAPATQGDPGNPASGQAPSTPLSGNNPLDILGTTVDQPQPAPQQSQAALEQPASEIGGNVVMSADELPRTGGIREQGLLALILVTASMLIRMAVRRRHCSESA